MRINYILRSDGRMVPFSISCDELLACYIDSYLLLQHSYPYFVVLAKEGSI